jgi:glycosyltransferase involved in cell wall biosynthesis
VHFHDKVKPEQINEYLSSADVGVVQTWNKSDLSYWYALDNKLFEYIQARIPVLATAQPEYVNIIETEKCGVCIDADQENAYINGFDKIIGDYENYQKNTETAAKKLSWENEKVHIQNLYKQISNA